MWLDGIVRGAYSERMRLSEWMEKGRRAPVSDDEMAAELGVSRATVSRLRRGKMVPSFALAGRIYEVTGRKVTPTDFIENLHFAEAS